MIITIAKKKTDLKECVELLSKIRNRLREDELVLEILEEYSFEKDILDGIPIDFSDKLDVSAKTKNSRIYLNSNLIDSDFDIIMRYVIHELVHSLQHMVEKYKGKVDKKDDYLDRPDELEAFQFQIKFDDESRGKDKAKEYIEDLLEYHEIEDHEKEEKKEELMSKI